MPLQKFRAGGNQRVQPEVTYDSRVDLAKIAPPALREDSKALVDKLSFRLFQETLGARETQTFITYLENKKPDTSDSAIRGLLHLMMSTPQFQLT